MKIIISWVIVLSLTVIFCVGSPAPQVDSENDSGDYGYDYGDYEDLGDGPSVRLEEAPERPADPLAGLFGFLANAGQGAVETLGNIAANQDGAQNRLGDGLDAAGDITSGLVSGLQAATQQLPKVLNNGRKVAADILSREEVQNVLANGFQLANMSASVAQSAINQAPVLLESGGRLAASVVEAANTTRPLVDELLKEYETSLPIIVAFVRAYADININQIAEIKRQFFERLQCNIKCRQENDSPSAVETCRSSTCPKIQLAKTTDSTTTTTTFGGSERRQNDDSQSTTETFP